jgi:hypothetical protein
MHKRPAAGRRHASPHVCYRLWAIMMTHLALADCCARPTRP